jgi:hypothetical protein
MVHYAIIWRPRAWDGGLINKATVLFFLKDFRNSAKVATSLEKFSQICLQMKYGNWKNIRIFL